MIANCSKVVRSVFVVLLCALSVAGTVVGCAQGVKTPAVASSASELGYALRYPDELARMRLEAETQLQLAEAVTEDLSKFPDALEDVEPEFSREIYRRADAEGRAQAFAQSFEEAASVNRFFSEEKQPLTNYVAGSAQRAAKKEACEVELYGSTSFSLEKAVGKQLEERSRERSAAHGQIEGAAKELKKKNVETLHSQADQINMASYIVNVRAVRLRQDLSVLQQQSAEVRDSLVEQREQLSEQPEPDEEAVKATDAALSQLDESTTQAEQTLKGLEERERAALATYEEVFSALLDALEESAEAGEKNAPSKN